MSNKMISLFSIGKTEQIGQQTTNNYGLDEEALIEKVRKNLQEAVTEEYISAEKVGKCCAELKKLLPEDPLANFYETAVSGTPQELSQSLLKIDCHSFGLSDLEEMATFLIKSLKPETCNSVAMLIDRIGGVNPSLHERVATRFDEEAQKVDEGIYDLTLPRDVFVAYRSADMDKVARLVDYLENTERLKCFVSYRNLQHGIGAKDHYDEWLKMAMDSCKVLVFVSSARSRREGDARHKELPYVKKKDEERSPGEYQAFGDYTKIPKEYKKPRVEYLIESYTAAESERFAKVFFDGFTQRESPKAVAQEIFRILDFGAASLQGEKTVQPATDEGAAATKEAEKQSEAEAARLAEEERKAEAAKQAEEQSKAEAAKQAEEQRKAEEAEAAEAAKQAEEQRKAEEAARRAEELRKRPWLAPDYPTLKRHDETEFRIEGTELKEYLKKDFIGEVKIPRGVTSIGIRAFYNCYRLTSITIPEGVKSIVYDVFWNCDRLTSITIPKSVTTIGAGAFSGCSELAKIEVDENNPVYHAQGNCLIKTKNKTLISGCKTSKIPRGVTSIGDQAFYCCSRLASITIPDSVESIGDRAFGYCSRLTSITIPEGVKSIGGGAFFGCSGLTSIIIPGSVTKIWRGAFSDCSGLTKIEVDENNRVYHAQGNCLIKTKSKTLISGCKTSKIPQGVKSIGASAFYGCSGLTSITIPDSVKSIGEKAFCYCSGLKSVIIPKSVESIGNGAFGGCSGLKSVIIPDSVESIGNGAFGGCSGLISITIPEGVKSIGPEAFNSCSGLISIIIPKSVKSIGMGAFRNCKNLTIYCVASRQPRGWNKDWNPDDCPVVWGYKKK